MPVADQTTLRAVMVAVQNKLIALSSTLCSGTGYSISQYNCRVVDREEFVPAEAEFYIQIAKSSDMQPFRRSGLNSLRSSLRVIVYRRNLTDDRQGDDQAIAGDISNGVLIILDRIGQYLELEFLSGVSPTTNLLVPLQMVTGSVIEGSPRADQTGFYRGYREFSFDIEVALANAISG